MFVVGLQVHRVSLHLSRMAMEIPLTKPKSSTTCWLRRNIDYREYDLATKLGYIFATVTIESQLPDKQTGKLNVNGR